MKASLTFEPVREKSELTGSYKHIGLGYTGSVVVPVLSRQFSFYPIGFQSG
jgi:hypothetical protein